MVLARNSGKYPGERMSSTAALSTTLSPPPRPAPGPAPTAAAPRRLSDEVDLYAEGNSFSEADWAGPDITALFGKDGFDFKDVLDVVNPLHHLPGVGTVYRALTGDELAPAPRVLGGTLFGGIAGFVVSLANAVLESETGSDIGDTVLALFKDDAGQAPVAASAPSAVGAAPAALAQTAARPSATAAGTIPTKLTSTSQRPGETEDPTAALIRALATVPSNPRSHAAGLPPKTARPLHTLPGGKTLPIQFRSGTEATAPPTPKPAPDASTFPASANAVTAEAAPDIAVMMQGALDKYETLMKSRAAPSISAEI